MRDFVRRPPTQKRQGQIMAAVDEALELFQDTLQEHHIQVRQVEETPLPPVAFDPKQVHQVLINLLKNALEAMPPGGEITITSRVKGANAEISVTDTGAGLAPEVAGNIFQPYFTTKDKGTGLGLAICQNIMARARRLHLCRQHPGPRGHLHHPTAPGGDLPGCWRCPRRRGKPRLGLRAVGVNHGPCCIDSLDGGQCPPCIKIKCGGLNCSRLTVRGSIKK